MSVFDEIEVEGRGQSDFWFACVDLAVIKDDVLSPCDKVVYSVICAHANIQTRSCPLKVKTISDEANCSVRSVQESLKSLVERGVIERTDRFENGKQKASAFRVVGHRAPCYRGADSAPTVEFCAPRGAENDTPSLREPNTYENKDNPPSEGRAEPCREPKSDEELLSLDEVPAVMRETVDYFLLKTGRTGITPEELSAVRALERLHTPRRVNMEIVKAVDRYGRNAKPLSGLTLVYIYDSLKFQTSGKAAKDKAPPKQVKKDPYEGAYL